MKTCMGKTVRTHQPLDAAVDGQHVGHVPVVEPEPGGVDQDGPVVGVVPLEGSGQLRRRGGEDREEEEAEERA